MLGLACGLVLRLGLVSGLYKWLFYLANCEATQQRRLNNHKLQNNMPLNIKLKTSTNVFKKSVK